MIRASDWRPRERNSLCGFVTLTLEPSGIVIRECTLHQKNERRWIGLPGRPQIDRDRQLRKDPATGKLLYAPIIEIAGKDARDRFQQAALAAVDRLLEREPAL